MKISQITCIINNKYSEFSVPVYALSEEDILNFIENCPEDSKINKRRRRKKKGKSGMENEPIEIPLLKGFQTNVSGNSSSTQRTASTPQNKDVDIYSGKVCIYVMIEIKTKDIK